MLQNNEFSEKLMEAYSFEKIVSKNPLMISYKKEDVRLNHYFSTGTVTVQDSKGSIKTHRDINGDSIEDIICKIN